MKPRKKKPTLKLVKPAKTDSDKHPLAELTFTATSKEALESGKNMRELALDLNALTKKYQAAVGALGSQYGVNLSVRNIFQVMITKA